MPCLVKLEGRDVGVYGKKYGLHQNSESMQTIPKCKTFKLQVHQKSCFSHSLLLSKHLCSLTARASPLKFHVLAGAYCLAIGTCSLLWREEPQGYSVSLETSLLRFKFYAHW